MPLVVALAPTSDLQQEIYLQVLQLEAPRTWSVAVIEGAPLLALPKAAHVDICKCDNSDEFYKS